MPGNDGDGGFATHVRVPMRGLCPVPDSLPRGLSLEVLSVVADAVTTPYEAIRRSGLGSNDVAVFVGVGGIGGFGVQIAAALGAATVAIDVDRERLDLAAASRRWLRRRQGTQVGCSFICEAKRSGRNWTQGV
jgi:6-hydroxycyclohex-1-ene-1-carbonyl-CoA dehydrogenase